MSLCQGSPLLVSWAYEASWDQPKEEAYVFLSSFLSMHLAWACVLFFDCTTYTDALKCLHFFTILPQLLLGLLDDLWQVSTYNLLSQASSGLSRVIAPLDSVSCFSLPQIQVTPDI